METNNNSPLNGMDIVADLKHSFSEQGGEMEEIISRQLPFMVKWGTVFFLILIICIMVICWMIRYPDIVSGSAPLTGSNTLKQVVTRTEGRLQKIWVEDGRMVEAGQWLACMESTTDMMSVLQLNRQLDTIDRLISGNRTEEILHFFPAQNASMNNVPYGLLGDLQAGYQTFIQAFTALKDYLGHGYYLRKKAMLKTDILQLQKMKVALQDQKALYQKDLELGKQTFTANEYLYREKAIAAFELRSEQSKLIAKELNLPQSSATIIANENQQNEKLKEIAELENQILVQKSNFIQALHTLRSQVQAWEYKYVIKAPVAGSCTLAGFFQEKQELRLGQPLFSIQPGNSNYYVEMLVPQYNFGKVKVGQKVMLKLAAYPYEQFGKLEGIVGYINPSPTDSGYLAKVNLLQGLQTNYNRPVQFREGLQAKADIITDDLRLLQRFYFSVSRQFTHQ